MTGQAATLLISANDPASSYKYVCTFTNPDALANAGYDVIAEAVPLSAPLDNSQQQALGAIHNRYCLCTVTARKLSGDTAVARLFAEFGGV